MSPALVSLLAYLTAAGLLTVTPGVDTAMVLRATAAGGPRSGAAAAAGVCLGCLAWGAGAALGLTVLLATSQLAYTVVKWAGAGYLLWLGIGLIVRPRDSWTAEAEAAGAASRWGAFRRGFLTNILNPKVGVFYITFLPQFIPPGANVAVWSMLLASLHVVMGAAWSAALIAAATPLRRFLRRPAVVKGLDRLVGGVFVAFGLRLALTER
jgi:threonine/homoserine/homoserine lactone efflux protein